MRGYTLSSPELRRGGGRGGRTDGRCIWSREDRSSRYLITQRSDWKRRGWKWTERLLLPGQWHFRWILLGRTREMMVLEDNSSPSTDQNSLPGGSPIVTSMRTPHSVGTSRPRSRCFFWLFAVTRMATKWYPEVKKQREREREKSQKAPVHCWGDVFFERKKKKAPRKEIWRLLISRDSLWECSWWQGACQCVLSRLEGTLVALLFVCFVCIF